MKKLILKSLSEIENSNYTGMKGEIVSVTGVGLAVHDGVTEGGTILMESAAIGDNILRNGNFIITQNGTTFTGNSGAATYILDGWFMNHFGGSTSNVAKLDNGARVTAISGGAANSLSRLMQVIPLPKNLSGKQVSLSFKAKSSNSLAIAAECFITGGGTKYINRFDLTNSFDVYTATFTIPEYTASDTLTDNFKIVFWIEAGDDWNSRTGGILAQDNSVDFEYIKMEFGSVATEFTYNYQDELSKVRRIFEKNGGDVPALLHNISIFGSSANDVHGTINYAEEKWKVVGPTFSVSHMSSSSTYAVGTKSFSVLGVWNGTSGSARVESWTCDAEIPPA